MKIDFYFDCSSPWTYLAFERVQPLAAEFGAEIVWRPILVGGVFNAVNPGVEFKRRLETDRPRKMAYYLKDLGDWTLATGLDISSDVVLAELCCAVDVDPDWLLERIAQQLVKDALRANTDEAIARGVFGSPTMFLDGGDMYFGVDRLQMLGLAMERKQAAR
jgi:2-hydroxychromene-2-carboxylate isomerase